MLAHPTPLLHSALLRALWACAVVLLLATPAMAAGSVTCQPATQASLQQGSSVIANAATLVVPEGTCPVTVSFSLYALPSGNVQPFEEQVLVGNVTDVYGPGTYSLTLDAPESCGYQSDLYLGPVLAPLTSSAHGGGILIGADVTNEGTPCDVTAACANVNFETDADGNALGLGTVIDDEYAGFGVTLSEASGRKLLVFDTANPTGGDTDLRTPGSGFGNTFALGNVLIISEDGDESDPDDNAGGGTIVFDFDDEVSVQAADLLDIDSDEGAIVRAYDAGGTLIAEVNAEASGNNSYQSVAVGAAGVRRLEVAFSSSGALAGLVFCEEPQGVCELDQGPPEVSYSFENPRHVLVTVTDDTGIESVEIDIANPDGGPQNLELVATDFEPGAMTATFRYRIVSLTQNATVRVVATDLCMQTQCPSDGDGSPDERPPVVQIDGQGDIAVGYAEHPDGLQSLTLIPISNVVVTQNTFAAGSPRADFQFDKIDPNRRGRFGLIAASACNAAVIDPDLDTDYAGGAAFLEAGGLVVVEAEHFTGTGAGRHGGEAFAWEAIGEQDGSSASAMQGLPNTGASARHTTFGPRLDYTLVFATPGTYTVWARAAGDSEGDNSVHVGFDGERVSPHGGLAVEAAAGWTWSARMLLGAQPITVEVTEPGRHTLNVWMREDGAQLDKLLLTLDPSLQPVGVGPDESPRSVARQAPGEALARDAVSGDAESSDPVSGDAPLAASKDSGVPATLALAQNYPNPFGASTTVEVALPEAAEVRLEVYNLLGQRVSVLADGAYEAGTHRFALDARSLASGTYVYRLATPDQSLTRRMTVVH